MRRLIRAALCAVAVIVVCAYTASSAFAYGALAWGSNEEGQLGANLGSSSLTAVTVGTLGENVTAVATAGGHSLAIVSGKVWAWGANAWGQDGTGNTTNHSLPVQVSGLEGVVAIAAGKDFSLALLSTGVVKAWGRNSFGELGTGSKEGPEECNSTAETETEAEKEEHACSKTPRTVTGVEASAISAGNCHALAVLTSGKVDAWGCNDKGQLGDGTSSGPQKCGGAAKEPCSTSPATVGELAGAKGVAAGGRFSLALIGEGEVDSWGSNASGQLGIGATSPNKCPGLVLEVGCSTSPVHVHVLEKATAIAAGDNHALAIEGAKLFAWGWNGAGQLGLGAGVESKSEPTEVKGLEPSSIAAGGEQSAVLLAGGVVKEAGANGYGQVGDGTTTNKSEFTTVHTSELAGVATGGQQTLVYGTPGAAVTSLSPTSGSSKGGYWVTVKGEHFAEVEEVLFGSSPATEVEVKSPTELRAKAPLAKPSNRNVIVKTKRSTSSATSASKFVFEPEGKIELGHCSKGGAKPKFKTGSCTEEIAEGAWEWVPGVVKGGFTTSLLTETSITIESTTGQKLTCTAVSGGGEFVAVKSVEKVILHLTGCLFEGAKCSSAGAGEGEVVTSTLEGAIGFIEKATNNLGLQLAPATGGETVFTAKCGSNEVVVKGGVIGTFNPANKTTSSFTVRFKQSAGKQKVGEFEEEGAPKESLRMSVNGGFSIQAGLALEAQTSNEEALEANTVV